MGWVLQDKIEVEMYCVVESVLSGASVGGGEEELSEAFLAFISVLWER